MNPTEYRLRLPGPTAVPEDIRQAIARPVLSHRGPEFVAILERIEEQLKPILGTRNPILLFASSGTGMMEASLVNVAAAGDRVLVCVNGQFGERFAGIAQALGIQVETLDVPWGLPIDPGEIEKRVAAREHRAVVVVHNESSTGVAADLAAIGGILKERPTLLVVDSVSGVGGMEMRQDEWGVDILATASQKALMCPPGIGLLSVGPKAWQVINRGGGLPRFYWDLRKAMREGEMLETPFTPAVSLLYGLDAALDRIHREGWPQVLARHDRLSAALRSGCAALGLRAFAQGGTPSKTVVAASVPEPYNGGDIIRAMYQRGTVIAGSRNKLKGRVIRIGTMGSVTEGDILVDLLHLEESLKELGWPVEPGAGLNAAREALNAR